MLFTELQSPNLETGEALMERVFHEPIRRNMTRNEAISLAERLRIRPDQMDLADLGNRTYDEEGYLLRRQEKVPLPRVRSCDILVSVEYGQEGQVRVVRTYSEAYMIGTVGEEGTNWVDVVTLDPEL